MKVFTGIWSSFDCTYILYLLSHDISSQHDCMYLLSHDISQHDCMYLLSHDMSQHDCMYLLSPDISQHECMYLLSHDISQHDYMYLLSHDISWLLNSSSYWNMIYDPTIWLSVFTEEWLKIPQLDYMYWLSHDIWSHVDMHNRHYHMLMHHISYLTL